MNLSKGLVVGVTGELQVLVALEAFLAGALVVVAEMTASPAQRLSLDKPLAHVVVADVLLGIVAHGTRSRLRQCTPYKDTHEKKMAAS